MPMTVCCLDSFVNYVSLKCGAISGVQVSADASARCTAVGKSPAGGQLRGGTGMAFLVLLLAILLYYICMSLGYLGPELHPSKLVQGLKYPFRIPGVGKDV